MDEDEDFEYEDDDFEDDFPDEELGDDGFNEEDFDFSEEPSNFQKSNNIIQNQPLTPLPQEETKKQSSTVKTSILLFVLGAAIIIISIKVSRVWLTNANDKIKNNKETAMISIVDSQSNNQPIGKYPENEETKKETKVQEEKPSQPIDTSWKELKNMPIMSNEASHSGIFTVTNKKIYMRATKNNCYELRYAIVGMIDGIEGEYEIEIPYASFNKINNASSFLISYYTNDYNGINVVYGIDY